MGQPPLRVLAEVTSTDFDGEPTERAEYGYPREGQKGKKPMGIGRRTAAAGEPLAVKGFSGKTADAVTVAEQIERLKHRFPLDAVVFGGDRGRVKATGKAALTEHRLKSIPALTAPPGRNLLKQDVIQVDVVEEIAQAGEDGDRRLGRRRNEAVCRTAANRRRDQLVKLQPGVAAGNAQVQGSPRADPTVGRRRRRAWANRHHLCCFVTLTLEDRQLILGVDEEKQADAALLEGCYGLETALSQAKREAVTVDPPYRDLQQVERHFRPLKTGLLEGRSIDVRKKNRTLGQVFAALRALKLGRELEVGLTRAFGTTAAGENALTITDALLCLSSSCLQRHPPAGQEVLPLPRPDAKQDAIFKALAVLPPRSGVQKPARV